MHTFANSASYIERIRVLRNRIAGTLPTEISRLVNIRVLGIGRNELHGTIPTQIATLKELSTIGLERNLFEGGIPSELGLGLTRSSLLFFDFNRLSVLPSELGNLETLHTLSINGNWFTGTVPSEICALETLQQLTADCEEIACPCCTQCCREDGECSVVQQQAQAKAFVP